MSARGPGDAWVTGAAGPYRLDVERWNGSRWQRIAAPAHLGRQGMLAICVTDDGRGGADPGRGTGLRGIERRLAVFDGVLALSSPSGGPTVVQLEIPCELS